MASCPMTSTNSTKQSTISSALASSNHTLRKFFNRFPQSSRSSTATPSISSSESSFENAPSQTEIDIIRTSWELVSQKRVDSDDKTISPSHAFGLAFYAALFELCPEAEPLFHNVFQQAKALTGMIAFIARAPKLTKQKRGTIKDMNKKKVEEEDPEWLALQMKELGARHYFYKIKPEYFDHVGPAFVTALKNRLGEEYTDEMGEAWAKVTIKKKSLLCVCVLISLLNRLLPMSLIT